MRTTRGALRTFFQEHAVLHYTGVRMGDAGRIHSYIDRYPPDHYNCAASDVTDAEAKFSSAAFRRPALTPCVSITHRCHGAGCTLTRVADYVRGNRRLPPVAAFVFRNTDVTTLIALPILCSVVGLIVCTRRRITARSACARPMFGPSGPG